MAIDNLKGRTALVTGGGSGIGRSMCLTFAAEGMHVVVADIEQGRADEVAAEVERTGAKALGLRCDVSKAESVEALADAAYARFGEVNLVCNNAGILQMGPVVEASQDDWEWLFAVNLWGVVNGVRTFVPRMRAQDGPGHVVNTASLSGVFAVPGLGVYTASKYAVAGLSETLRLELEADGIGVSILCPGPTRSRIGETGRYRFDDDERVAKHEQADMTYLGFREPDQVAVCVRDAVLANRLYVFSHATGQAPAERRFDELLGAFNHAP